MKTASSGWIRCAARLCYHRESTYLHDFIDNNCKCEAGSSISAEQGIMEYWNDGVLILNKEMGQISNGDSQNNECD
jgi:hypothetical protein